MRSTEGDRVASLHATAARCFRQHRFKDRPRHRRRAARLPLHRGFDRLPERLSAASLQRPPGLGVTPADRFRPTLTCKTRALDISFAPYRPFTSTKRRRQIGTFIRQPRGLQWDIGHRTTRSPSEKDFGGRRLAGRSSDSRDFGRAASSACLKRGSNERKSSRVRTSDDQTNRRRSCECRHRLG